MKGFWAFFKRKRAEAVAERAPPEEKPLKPEHGRFNRFMGGACEKTPDLLVGVHDGERVGFRKPVQG